MHWYLIIYKAILGMLPSYLCCLNGKMLRNVSFVHKIVILSVPFVRTELGKKAFMYAAPSDWNLKLQKLLSLDHFKTVIQQIEDDSMICNCFKCF